MQYKHDPPVFERNLLVAIRSITGLSSAIMDRLQIEENEVHPDNNGGNEGALVLIRVNPMKRRDDSQQQQQHRHESYISSDGVVRLLR